jgi:hypothetical protein
MGVVAEPVETGLVTNLARPDGNIGRRLHRVGEMAYRSDFFVSKLWQMLLR